MEKLDKNLKPDMRLSAVCGLFCPSCNLYIGTKEDPERLEGMSKRMGKTVDDVSCNGCRSDKRSFYCTNLCTMAKCASEKGIEFCGECDEYPCDELKEFQAARPHRIELWDSLKNIKENGYEKWFCGQAVHYSCPECGTINSAYDLKCRQCGKTPSSEYTKLHKNNIMEYFEKNGGK